MDKRFLGLGFSFAATDKNLEKKLKAIHTYTDKIQKDLTKVTKAAKTATAALKKMKVPSGTGASVRASAIGAGVVQGASQKTKVKGSSVGHAHSTKASKAARNPAAGTKFMDLSDAIAQGAITFARARQQVEGLLKGMGIYNQVMKLNRKQLAQMDDMLMDMSVSVAKVGANVFLTKDSLQGASKQIRLFLKKNKELEKDGIPTLHKVFVAITGYIKDLGHSVNNFLHTVGVDLERMIPPQIGALAGVGKSLLSPLKGGIDMTYRKLMGFKGNGKDTLKGILTDIKNNTSPHQRGLLDKLKDLLTGGLGRIPVIGALLSGLTTLGFKLVPWLVKGLWDFGKYLLNVPWGEVITAVGDVAEIIGGMLMDTLMGLVLPLVLVTAAVTAVAFLFGFLSEAFSKENLAIAGKFGKALFGVVGSLGKFAWAYLKSGRIVKDVGEIFSNIGSKLTGLWESLKNVSFADIGDFVKSIGSRMFNAVAGINWKKLPGEMWSALVSIKDAIVATVKFILNALMHPIQFLSDMKKAGVNSAKWAFGKLNSAADWLQGKSKEIDQATNTLNGNPNVPTPSDSLSPGAQQMDDDKPGGPMEDPAMKIDRTNELLEKLIDVMARKHGGGTAKVQLHVTGKTGEAKIRSGMTASGNHP